MFGRNILKRGLAILLMFSLICGCTLQTFASGGTDTKDFGEEHAYEIRFQDGKSEFPYTGEQVKPTIYVVNLKEGGIVVPGDCYQVSYSNNIAEGVGTVVISGVEEKGYCGSLALNFTIKKEEQRPPVIPQKNGLVAPTIKSAKFSSKGKGSIQVKWSKVNGAKGYYVYRATSLNGKYKKKKTITSRKKLSYKDGNIKKGKTYYYKIVGYKVVKKKKMSGLASAPFACVTTKAEKVSVSKTGYTIYVNKQTNVVTVYNNKAIPVKAFVCSTGTATPTGTFYTKDKYRWHELMGNCWGQWDTRIVDGILFHSVYYTKYNSNTSLSVSAFNKLGTTASHGCVRLKAGDAKWIYDNCDLKTKVVIFKSSSKGPLGKPSAPKLASWHTWDPTDPNCKSKCKAKKCH